MFQFSLTELHREGQKHNASGSSRCTETYCQWQQPVHWKWHLTTTKQKQKQNRVFFFSFFLLFLSSPLAGHYRHFEDCVTVTVSWGGRGGWRGRLSLDRKENKRRRWGLDLFKNRVVAPVSIFHSEVVPIWYFLLSVVLVGIGHVSRWARQSWAFAPAWC